jgi:hypothetical protein
MKTTRTAHFLFSAILGLACMEAHAEERTKPKQDIRAAREISEPEPAAKTAGQRKNDQLVYPKVSFEDTALAEGLDFISGRAALLSPDKQPLNFVLDLQGYKPPKLTLNLVDIPLMPLLETICKLTRTKLEIEEHLIRIVPSETAAVPQNGGRLAMLEGNIERLSAEIDILEAAKPIPAERKIQDASRMDAMTKALRLLHSEYYQLQYDCEPQPKFAELTSDLKSGGKAAPGANDMLKQLHQYRMDLEKTAASGLGKNHPQTRVLTGQIEAIELILAEGLKSAAGGRERVGK